MFVKLLVVGQPKKDVFREKELKLMHKNEKVRDSLQDDNKAFIDKTGGESIMSPKKFIEKNKDVLLPVLKRLSDK